MPSSIFAEASMSCWNIFCTDLLATVGVTTHFALRLLPVPYEQAVLPDYPGSFRKQGKINLKVAGLNNGGLHL